MRGNKSLKFNLREKKDKAKKKKFRVIQRQVIFNFTLRMKEKSF